MTICLCWLFLGYDNIIFVSKSLKVNESIRIDRLIERINTYTHAWEQEVFALNKRVQQLELDLQDVQKELENYYLLSRQQADLLRANAELHKRAADLLVRKSD